MSIEKNLNKIFNIVEKNEDFGQKTKDEVKIIKEKIKNIDFNDYCSETLKVMIEQSKDIFEVFLKETEMNYTDNNIRALSSLLTAITNTVVNLEKINEKSNKKDNKEINNNINIRDIAKILKEEGYLSEIQQNKIN